MELKKPNDTDLIQSVINYKQTGNLEPFIEIASVWAIVFARDNFGICDGLETEMYFTIRNKKDESLKLFKESPPSKFPYFFSTYCRHLSFNLVRVHKKKKNENYLSLWNERRQENPNVKNFREEKMSDLKNSIQNLSALERVVFCLRFNLEFDDEAKILFKEKLKNKNLDSSHFYESISLKILENNQKQELLLRKLNSLNRRIFLKQGDLNKLKERKKQITRILERPTKYFSFKELSAILDIPVHNVNIILNRSIKQIKTELCKRAA